MLLSLALLVIGARAFIQTTKCFKLESESECNRGICGDDNSGMRGEVFAS